ncbi:MAG: phosphotransferase [Truepera sp.]|nr:phosphotransferase [Truepera sp.]
MSVPYGAAGQRRGWRTSRRYRRFIGAEGAITSTLERLFPGRVPTVLAFDAGRGWLLLDEFRGRSIPKGDPAWLEVVRSYAAMQIECAPLASRLRATGFADRRLEVFRAQIARLFRESGTVLAREERGRLTKLEARILASLDELYGFGLPETLVHGDLHFGNVVKTDDGPLFFDWTDAAVAHPFLDLFTLLDFDLDSDLAGAVRPSYLEPWLTSWDAHDLDRAFDIAIDLSLVYSAISYQLIVEAQEPADRWQLGGFVEWALRELLRRTGL